MSTHEPNGWSCCDACRAHYSKEGTRFMRAAGRASRRKAWETYVAALEAVQTKEIVDTDWPARP